MDKKEHLKMAEISLEKALEKYFELRDVFAICASKLDMAINRVEDELLGAHYHLKEGEDDEE